MVDGAHAYLHKPCNIEDILDAVAKAYKRRLMNKFKMKEDRLDALIDADNPKGTALGALRAMEKLEKGFKGIS